LKRLIDLIFPRGSAEGRKAGLHRQAEHGAAPEDQHFVIDCAVPRDPLSALIQFCLPFRVKPASPYDSPSWVGLFICAI